MAATRACRELATAHVGIHPDQIRTRRGLRAGMAGDRRGHRDHPAAQAAQGPDPPPGHLHDRASYRYLAGGRGASPHRLLLLAELCQFGTRESLALELLLATVASATTGAVARTDKRRSTGAQ